MNRLLALWCLYASFALAKEGPQRMPNSSTDAYCALRSGLLNCRIRFTRDGQGRVAFMGGSITQMKGWRAMTCEMLQKRFPKTQFDFVDAGISSTDTAMGPFRLQRDVFGQGQVDLFFVEFAVNDKCNGRTPTESVRGMEGIVRQALQTNPCIDIIMLHFVDPTKMREFNSGKTPGEIAAHEKVAEHYRVPSIDLAREVTERINAGEFAWKTFGGLHPAPFGHRIYTRAIGRLLDAAWQSPLPDDARPVPHPIPAEAVDPLNYSRGRFVGLKEAQIVNGWQLVPSWQPDRGHTRRGFVRVPMLIADQPDATLRLKFSGTAIGIVVAAGHDVGVLALSIDGSPTKQLDQFTPWSRNLHIPWVYMLAADLNAGEHELTLRTTSKKNPKSQGHAARIVQFVAN